MSFKDLADLLKIYNEIVIDHQRTTLKALAELIELNTGNTKLTPADAFTINFALALQETPSKDNHKDDPYTHIHGIC